MTTVWCTKCALTEGITERKLIEIDGRYAKVEWAGMLNGWTLMGHGDWYESQEEAIARAARMRKARIKSLYKQIAALEALSVKVIPLNWANSPTD